jgi:exonuclease SbcC
MLKHLTVEDFQSHKVTDIELVPGVNVICGLSQSGKTALLRGLNWVVNNRPLGDGFIRHEAKEAFVTLIGETGGKVFSVSRLKSKSDSYYHVVVGDEDNEFRAFGADVPEQVRKLLNMNDINIQEQLSPYFLVLDSPGQIAQYIRGIAKLDVIDTIVAALASKLRMTIAEIERNKTDLQEVDDKLEVLGKIDLATLKDDIVAYELCVTTKFNLTKTFDEVSILLSDLIGVEEELNKIRAVDISALNAKYDECKDLQRLWEKLDSEADDLHMMLEDLDVVLCSMITLPDDVDERVRLCREVSNEEVNLRFACGQINHCVMDVATLGKQLNRMNLELEGYESERTVLLSLVQMCPYCGQSLDDKSKDHLMEKVCLAG